MLLKPFRQSDICLPTNQLNTGIKIQYLGTAGFILSGENREIVVDPFVTRPSLRTTIKASLKSDSSIVQKIIPRADDVVIGHSHHDHILDAPEVCLQTGARLIGSPDSCIIGAAAGIPKHQLRETTGNEKIECGEHCFVQGFPSVHGRVFFNQVGLKGAVSSDFTWPAKFTEFRHGLVLNWLITMGGVRIMHIDSADFIEENLQGINVDVLCLCAIGRKWRQNYVSAAVRILQPKIIIACHWDYFFTPFSGPHYLLPGVDLKGFVTEIRQSGVDPVVLPIGGSLQL
jgi:L-ascorbate metabolism protein UlaG (beta-lactamase superfamily)